ncbi:hypothetical protein [Micromonospora pisi]|nr:hypothetical protein [Micromonospora pisi]
MSAETSDRHSAGASDRGQVERRAEYLLPEERAAGSEDPLAQARAILAESDRRTSDVDGPSDARRERRTSQETVTPSE